MRQFKMLWVVSFDFQSAVAHAVSVYGSPIGKGEQVLPICA